MLRSMTAILKASGFVIVLAVTVTYAAVTRITVYRNTIEIELIKSRLDGEVVTRGVKDDGINERITALEKTVYVAPGPKEALRRPAALEQWMVNAANELRQRIMALERWRLQQER
jgi:hypothetical protein